MLPLIELLEPKRSLTSGRRANLSSNALLCPDGATRVRLNLEVTLAAEVL